MNCVPPSSAWRIPARLAGILASALLVCLGLCGGGAQAAPAFQAAGTAASGTGAVNVPWPAHAAGDTGLLFVESAGGEPATLATAAGFVPVSNSPQFTGTTTTGTRVTVFWARATSAAMPTPRVADAGNHDYARILTYRGVAGSGDPWDVTGGGIKSLASIVLGGITTTTSNTRIVQAVTRDTDSAAAFASAQTNPTLAGIAERADAGTTQGNGGGIAVWDGDMAAAGATGSTTATVGASGNAYLTLALKPQPGPRYQAAGTAVGSVNAVSPAWPAHAVDDVALLFVESTGGQAANLLVPAGFQQVASSPQATGAGTAGTRLTVYWARATSTTMPAPTVADPGNHVYARIITYRGVANTGNPWDVAGGGVKAPASTGVSVTGVTTTVADTLVVQAATRDNDSAATAFSAQANASLVGITERSDGGTTSGNGGGIGIWDGYKATAGATGATTATVTSSVNAFITIALRPQGGGGTPAFQAVGTAVGGTGNVSPAWPAHAIGDVALLFVESAGGEPVTLSVPNGFAAAPGSPQATGTGTAGTQLTVFWARATSAAMAAPTVADPGDHVYARIVTYRGVIGTGSPFDGSGGGVRSSAGVTVTGVTTTVADTRVVQVVSRDNDSAAAAFSAQTNANLVGITERSDAGTTSGNGGGFAVWDGVKATAGATGDTTAAVAVASENAFLTIALRSAIVPPDHYELSTPSATVSCLAGTVTVTACADNVSPCTNKYTAASGTTATLATSAGTLGATTVTFDATGVATTTLSYPAAADGATTTVTLSAEQIAAANPRKCCQNGTCSVANSCDTTFNIAGFIFAAAADAAETTVPAQTAGAESGKLWLRAVRTGTTTKACEAALSGASTVGFAYQCNNPTTCYATSPPACGAGSGYFCLTPYSSDGATAQTPQPAAANPNSGVTSYASVTMNFDANGNAPFTFRYADVGQLRLWASKAAGGSLLTSLSGVANPGGPFVVKPAGLVLSGIKCTTADAANCGAGALAMPTPGDNPAAADAAGVTFIRAGHPFTATVTATTAGGAATPSFGRETSAQGATLTHNLVDPAGGAAGTLGGTLVIPGASFQGGTKGVATVSDLTWSEVGIVRLASYFTSGSYLGASATYGTMSSGSNELYVLSVAGISVGDTITVENAGAGNTLLVSRVVAIDSGLGKVTLADPSAAPGLITGQGVNRFAPSANVGRFYPHHFSVSSTLVPRGDVLALFPSTTGSVGAGSAALTVASAAGVAVGHALRIAGAGAGGAPLGAVVTAVAGTTLTLGTAAVTGVANAAVHDLSALAGTPDAFAYMNEPMLLLTTVTALNAAEGTTSNYASSNGFARLDAATLGTGASWMATGAASCPPATQCFGFGAIDGTATPTPLTGRLAVDTGVASPASHWSAGVGSFAALLRLNRPATTTSDATWGPFNTLWLGVAPRDADGVTLPDAASADAAHRVNLDADNDATNERWRINGVASSSRFGRLRLLNAYGSELLNSRVEVRAEYWDGARWTTNALDKLTTLAVGNVYRSNPKGIGLPTVNAITQFSGGSGGIGLITFNPTYAAGSFDIALNLNASGSDTSCNAAHGGTAAGMPWLQGFWAAAVNCNGVAAFAQDPNARIKLGSPRAPYIYQRERY